MPSPNAVTANDAAAAGLLPLEQAEAMSQKGVAPTARQLELLQLARPAKRTCRAIVVGLDGVGKTSILAALRTGRTAEGVAPTQGCNKSALVCHHAGLEPRTSRHRARTPD